MSENMSATQIFNKHKKKTIEITFLVMEHYQLNLSYILHKNFHLFLKTHQPAFVNNKGF